MTHKCSDGTFCSTSLKNCNELRGIVCKGKPTFVTHNFRNTKKHHFRNKKKMFQK